MNILVCVLVIRARLAVDRVTGYVYVTLETGKQFSGGIVQLTLLPAVYESSDGSTPQAGLGVVCTFHFRQPMGCAVESHRGLFHISLKASEAEHLDMFIGHLGSLFCKVLGKFFSRHLYFLKLPADTDT